MKQLLNFRHYILDSLTYLESILKSECQMSLFNRKEIRKVFHDNEWFLSVIDVIEAITESDRPSKYWTDLKRQLSENEGFSQLSENIGKLKMPGADGKFYPTEAVNVETLFRIIQSAQGLEENKSAATSGGRVAGSARKDLEKTLGRSVVTKDNFLKPKDGTKTLPKKT